MYNCNIIALSFSLIIALTTSVTAAENNNLSGNVAGAEIMQVTTRHAQIDSIGDVVYEQIKSLRSVKQMHMSVLVPRTAAKKPAIIYFPGGGFTSAEHNKFIEMRMALAEAGFVVAAAEYRTVPNTFPAPVVDAKAAVRYLRQHASDYGIDPERIGVLGDSAGGWLAQMLGTTNLDKTYDKGDFLDQSSDVQAVVSLYGLSDLRSIGEGFSPAVQKVHNSPAVTEALILNGPAFRNFAGKTIPDSSEKALQASPIGHLDGPKPPFLIMHGSKDSLVSPKQSANIYQALKDKGADVEYILVKGAEHGDYHWYQPVVIERVVKWFGEQLKPEKMENALPVTRVDSNL